MTRQALAPINARAVVMDATFKQLEKELSQEGVVRRYCRALRRSSRPMSTSLRASLLASTRCLGAGGQARPQSGCRRRAKAPLKRVCCERVEF